MRSLNNGTRRADVPRVAVHIDSVLDKTHLTFAKINKIAHDGKSRVAVSSRAHNDDGRAHNAAADNRNFRPHCV